MPKNKTSFKSGQESWNKTNLFKNCINCNKEFKVTPSCLKNRPCKYCSRECHRLHGDDRRKVSISKEKTCLDLAKEGKTIKEISEITGFPCGSVSSYLNKAKYRKRKKGLSYAAKAKALKKIYKKCKICEFDRIIEIAHIIPASRGGDLTESNTIALCPNHHHLFDTKQLTNDEALKLKDRVVNYKDHIKKNKYRKKDYIIGINEETSTSICFRTNKDLEKAGYLPSCVIKVLKGLRRTYRGMIWYKQERLEQI